MKRIPISFITAIMSISILMLSSPSIISVSLLPSSNNNIEEVKIGSFPFIEGLELIAANSTALIVEYSQVGGEKILPFDPDQYLFDKLELAMIVSSNQQLWRRYWPRPIWEFRDGITVVLQFSQDIQSSLTDTESIISLLSNWMNVTLDILFGAYENGLTTVILWGFQSSDDYQTYISDVFYNFLNKGGFTDFITSDAISNSPVSVAGLGLVRNSSRQWNPLTVTSFIIPKGIEIQETASRTHNMSLNSAFNYSGSIHGAPKSIISGINFKLPYVANVFDIYPKTTNLYPELTGKYEWLIKLKGYANESYDDLFVTYDMAINELEIFPQITGDLSVDVGALRNSTNPTLNYTLNIKNTGTEIAHNTTFVWDLEKEPEPIVIPVFDSERYFFNSTMTKFFNFTDGTLVDTLVLRPESNVSIQFTGWFQNLTSNSPVEPITTYNSTYDDYDISFVETYLMIYKDLYFNKSFINFQYSQNMGNITLDNGHFALTDTVDELSPGSSENYWWGLSDLPSSEDEYLLIDLQNASLQSLSNGTQTYYQFNLTWFDNTSARTGGITNLQKYLVNLSLTEGSSLRYPTIGPDIIPGVMFIYSDNAQREYFGWSNGLIIQLYDNEAILRTNLAFDKPIYRVGDMAKINVSIENIGDASADNVNISLFTTQLNSSWDVVDIIPFNRTSIVDAINPGESITYIFDEIIRSSLGIHPVVATIDYITEKAEGKGTVFNATRVPHLSSNLLIALVLPQSNKAGRDEPSFPTPSINVSVDWADENGGEIENGDILEIKTSIKNIGDESTTIKVFSYFPTRIANIYTAMDYDNGKNFKITDLDNNILSPPRYLGGFAINHPDWPISVAGFDGLHLSVNEEIIFYYKLVVGDNESLILPPVHVEYTSRFPLARSTGIEDTASESQQSNQQVINTPFKMISIDNKFLSLKLNQENLETPSWSSYSSPTILKVKTTTTSISTISSTSITTTPTSEPTDSFTSLVNFLQENVRFLLVFLAIPLIGLIIHERRRK